MAFDNPPGDPGFAAPPPGFGGPPGIGGPAVRPPRPRTVTLAVALMGLQVLLSIIGAVVPFLMKSQLVEAYRTMPTKPGQPTMDPETQFLVNVGGGACGAVIGAIILGILAFFLLRGANVARIFTWVLGGLSLCCNVVGVVGVVILAGAKFPGAYVGMASVTAGLGFVTTLAIIVLLALPASNAYFKPKPAGQLY